MAQQNKMNKPQGAPAGGPQGGKPMAGPGGRPPRGMKGPKVENPGKIFKRLMAYVLKRYGIHYSVVILCIFGSVFASVQGTLFTRTLIDDYIVPLVGKENPVFTGLIKANIPSRIALKVGSGVDSRVIIDEQGAEKLIGKGDMLLKTTSMPKPKRVQGCWISDKEIERVVNFIKDSFILEYDDDVMNEVERQAELVRTNDKKSDTSAESGDIDVSDDKLEEAIRVVVEAGQASTSSLQRRLKLGYGRAARLIDIMEEMGIVGPSEGSKPRQVLMTREQYYERQMNNNN